MNPSTSTAITSPLWTRFRMQLQQSMRTNSEINSRTALPYPWWWVVVYSADAAWSPEGIVRHCNDLGFPMSCQAALSDDGSLVSTPSPALNAGRVGLPLGEVAPRLIRIQAIHFASQQIERYHTNAPQRTQIDFSQRGLRQWAVLSLISHSHPISKQRTYARGLTHQRHPSRRTATRGLVQQQYIGTKARPFTRVLASWWHIREGTRDIGIWPRDPTQRDMRR
jgi:hypothetical protein